MHPHSYAMDPALFIPLGSWTISLQPKNATNKKKTRGPPLRSLLEKRWIVPREKIKTLPSPSVSRAPRKPVPFLDLRLYASVQRVRPGERVARVILLPKSLKRWFRVNGSSC